MPDSRSRRLTAVLDAYLPTPARLLLVFTVLALNLCAGGILFPPAPASGPSEPAAAVTITPDDPAAPTPVPVQLLGR
jgi:hypothetical protein